FSVERDPSRLVQAPNQTARTLLTWDAVGDHTGDIEIATVVQIPADNAAANNGARFQLHLNASGTEGAETSYWLDQAGNNLRLGQFSDGAQNTNLQTAAVPGGVERYTWYHVVFGR